MKFSKMKSYYRALNGLFLLLLLINVQQFLQPVPTAKAPPVDPLILKWKYNAAATTQAAVSGDLNGDGVYDVVVSGVGKVVAINGAAAHTWSLTHYGGNLDPSTILWTYTPASGSGISIGDHHPCEIADVNNDGLNEVIVSAYYPVVLNGQTGQLLWTTKATLAYQNYNANFDINGDGYKEIFTTSGIAFNSSYDFLGKLSYNGNLLNQASAWHTCYGGITVADANFDGVFETYVADRSVGYVCRQATSIREAGMGIKALDAETLKPLWNDPTVLCSSQTPMLADVDKDGVLEVIVADQSNSGIAVYNAADGSVSTSVTESGTIYRKGNTGMSAHSQPTVGVFDDSGDLFLIDCRLSGTLGKDATGSGVKIWDLYTWKPVGIGKLQNTTIPANATDLYALEPPKAADVDGDGEMELIAMGLDWLAGTPRVYLCTSGMVRRITLIRYSCTPSPTS